ncbi:hypothetical protein NMG60_11027094 [Bertholletia excelsa]
MASGGEEVAENLRKQLAMAVRSIQWSYAIFWAVSSRQPGLLEWCDGYYNGDIKTRKTVQAAEFNSDQLELQRSEQLRELYESLLAGESSPHQARRHSAALSPEDLTDTEWYYLVCMSFVFNTGQGLPGRTMENGQLIWLCNAHYADSKVFSRSLLAKSASIQTVVCFPFLGGVVELGVTELVAEDPSLIQHVKSSFFKIPYTIISKTSKSVSRTAQKDKILVHPKLDEDFLDTSFNAIVGCEEVEAYSPNNSLNGFAPNQHAEESLLLEELMDEEVSNCAHNSMSSSDCMSQTIINPEKDILIFKRQNGNCLLDLQEQKQKSNSSVGLQADDSHYQIILSSLLKSSDRLILGQHFRKFNQKSSFVSWKQGSSLGIQMTQSKSSQKLLKKALFEVSRMHLGYLLDTKEDKKRDDIDSNHVSAERRRREKISERFSVLGSLVPSPSKTDKVSILDNTINYLKQLKRRVEELDSCREVAKPDMCRRKALDAAERTSDNYGNNNMNKRKACEIYEVEPEISNMKLKDGLADNISIRMIERDVLITIRCPWRECLLLEIMDAISHLHLDSHSVQSINKDGILSLTVKSQFKGSTVASAGSIRQTLRRVIRKW